MAFPPQVSRAFSSICSSLALGGAWLERALEVFVDFSEFGLFFADSRFLFEEAGEDFFDELFDTGDVLEAGEAADLLVATAPVVASLLALQPIFRYSALFSMQIWFASTLKTPIARLFGALIDSNAANERS